MTTLNNLILLQVVSVEELIRPAAGEDAQLKELYEVILAPVLDGIRSGAVAPPSDALTGYWYYFSPEGPWDLWSRFPSISEAVAKLINLLEIDGDDQFRAYLLRRNMKHDDEY